MEELMESILEGVNSNISKTTRRKFKSILESLGYKRNSQRITDEINVFLKKFNIKSDREITTGLSKGVWITFWKENDSNQSLKIKETIKTEHFSNDKLIVPNDFFYELFDFDSYHEYERFQAALDSSSPIGLFVIPEYIDFYGTIVERILSFEIVRKRQYMGLDFHIGKSSESDFKNNEYHEMIDNGSDLWISKDIHNFSQEKMQDVILGVNGTDLISSKMFDEKFNQLSLYSNKYFNQQFFILFHCPSNFTIIKHNRQDLLDAIIEKISYKLPYVFKLKCKFKTDDEIPREIKKRIIDHFKLLLEVPSIEIDVHSKLIDSFIELQKGLLQSENQVLSKIEPHKFSVLEYGYESDEHIYLKYFAINTLADIYDINCIKTEATEIVEEGNKKFISRPDVIANNEIIVEIETLRGKATDKNVYLQLIDNIIKKSNGWKNTKLKELWLVVPGFEISRNYYQLQKVVEMVNAELQHKFSNKFECKIFAPDYNSLKLVEVDFSNIYKLTFERGKSFFRPQMIEDYHTSNALTFDSVIGLNEEKKDLQKIIELQNRGYSSLIKGIIFFGLPGCGKTLLAKSFAAESERYFFSFSPSDIASGLIGIAQKRIAEIFSQVKAKSPSILFIDEIDSIAFSRNTHDTAHTDQKATINQLLIELNDIHENDDDVIVIAATNRLNSLDPSLKRSGRFDRKIPILPPNMKERAELFEHYINCLRNIKGLEDLDTSNIDYEKLGKKSFGFTSSDINAIINEIKIKLLIQDIDRIETERMLIDIEIFRETGQCSINKKMVEEFAEELLKNRYNTKKINAILNELK